MADNHKIKEQKLTHTEADCQHNSWLVISAEKQLRHKDASVFYNILLNLMCASSDVGMVTSTNSMVLLVVERERYIDQVRYGR